MAGIMKTLWDESSELSEEALSTCSVLSDDYTSGVRQEQSDILNKSEEIEEVIDEELHIEKKDGGK